ncbi:hypothetical protein BJ165DRAFT_1398296 [Panaeolus papilionaceus]|nr:hypothetical protein BJ165DRAFT_1398296 [Panaeolus papilionaceus]
MQLFTNVAAVLLTCLAALVTQTAAQECSPTGPGVCNTSFHGRLFAFGGIQKQELVAWTEMNIYDNSCNPLGTLDNPKEGVAVELDDLSFPVVINKLLNENVNDLAHSIGFCYADKCYDEGFACAVEDRVVDFNFGTLITNTFSVIHHMQRLLTALMRTHMIAVGSENEGEGERGCFL